MLAASATSSRSLCGYLSSCDTSGAHRPRRSNARRSRKIGSSASMRWPLPMRPRFSNRSPFSSRRAEYD